MKPTSALGKPVCNTNELLGLGPGHDRSVWIAQAVALDHRRCDAPTCACCWLPPVSATRRCAPIVRLSGWTFGLVVANQVALLVVLAVSVSPITGVSFGLHLRLHLLPAAVRDRGRLHHDRRPPPRLVRALDHSATSTAFRSAHGALACAPCPAIIVPAAAGDGHPAAPAARGPCFGHATSARSGYGSHRLWRLSMLASRFSQEICVFLFLPSGC